MMSGMALSRTLPRLLQPARPLAGQRRAAQRKPAHKVLLSGNVNWRQPSVCDGAEVLKPCLDPKRLEILRGDVTHEKLIRSFLHAHYWPREPAVCAVWMPQLSPYLRELTELYATSGDRFIAYERQERTNENKMVGLLVAHQVHPWTADEYETWALGTCLKAERTHMLFKAHTLRSPNLFEAYHLPYIYEIAVVVVAPEVQCHGIGTELIKRAVGEALELRHPMIQCAATSLYAQKACIKAFMNHTWEMPYSEFVDENGLSQFYPRPPHVRVVLYTKKFDKWKEGQTGYQYLFRQPIPT